MLAQCRLVELLGLGNSYEQDRQRASSQIHYCCHKLIQRLMRNKKFGQMSGTFAISFVLFETLLCFERLKQLQFHMKWNKCSSWYAYCTPGIFRISSLEGI